MFAEYYGFFLQDDSVEESEVTLYNEIVENSKQVRSSKIRSLGRKSYFHEKFRHVFWFSVTLILSSPSKISKELMSASTRLSSTNAMEQPKTAAPKSQLSTSTCAAWTFASTMKKVKRSLWKSNSSYNYSSYTGPILNTFKE